MIEQLPPELAKLIAAERAAPVADHAIRAAVRAKVAATVAGAPLGAAAAAGGAGLFGAGKIIAIIAVVVGAGTVAVVKTQHSPSTTTARVSPVVAHAEKVPPEPPPPPVATQSLVPAPIEATQKQRSARSVALPPEPPPPVIPSQVEMLQEAWADIGRGEAAQALDLAVRDEELHANGALSEERAALRIVALAKLGRTTEASEANVEFAAKYPASIHRSTIARALAGRTP
jgi:type IV secretory pathway VirB10-like protein